MFGPSWIWRNLKILNDFAEGKAFNTINDEIQRYFGTRRSEASKMFMMVFDV
jgi:hypothetical protein